MARVVDSRRSSWLLVGFVLLHLMVISHQVDGGGGVSLLERFVLTALGPFQRATAGAIHGVGGFWGRYMALRGTHEENARLKRRVAELQQQVREREEKARQAERLQQILGLREILPYETVVADVIARDGQPWFRTLTLNKGREHGIGLNAPVVGPSGVLGRVIGVGPRVARVQLLQDRDCGVGGRIERSRVTGVVSGQVGVAGAGTPELLMKYVPAEADVAVGDMVVTSGLDRIFPKGLVVGRVLSVAAPAGLFKEVLVAPSARFGLVEEAMVLRVEPEALAVDEEVG